MAFPVRPTNWNFHRLFSEVLDGEDRQTRLMRWAKDNHLLPTEKLCTCGHRMTLVNDWRIASGYFLCRADGRQVPWVKGTIFELDSSGEPINVVILMLCYVNSMTVNQAEEEVSYKSNIELGLRNRYVYNFFVVFQQTISEFVYRRLTPLTDYVGGPGTIVQAIPTEFPRRKKSPSTIQAGTRILALIQNGSPRFSIIVYPGLTRNLETFELLQTRVRRRTTIVIPDAEKFKGLDTNKLYTFSGDLRLLSRPYRNVMDEGLYGTNLPRVCTADKVMVHIFYTYCDLRDKIKFDEFVKVLKYIYPGN